MKLLFIIYHGCTFYTLGCTSKISVSWSFVPYRFIDRSVFPTDLMPRCSFICLFFLALLNWGLSPFDFSDGLFLFGVLIPLLPYLGAIIKPSKGCLSASTEYCDPWSGKWGGGYWGFKGQVAYTCLMLDMPAKMVPVGRWGVLPGNWLGCLVLTG